ncbi:hypothetical protein TNCV_3188031 [Trichonephila clavipes]|nr:hypothetical protein TNCV_3188031 [Trichonephila clavipes]
MTLDWAPLYKFSHNDNGKTLNLDRLIVHQLVLHGDSSVPLLFEPTSGLRGHKLTAIWLLLQLVRFKFLTLAWSGSSESVVLTQVPPS